VLVCFALYLLPAILGSARHVNSSGMLAAVNVVFAWTGAVWFVCLIWAVCGQTRERAECYSRAVITQRADQFR
jgi:hypothetical protein